MGVKQNEIEIKDKLNTLTDKLVTNLSLKGVSADNSMTLNTLADKVVTIGDIFLKEIDRNLPVVTYIDHIGVIYEVNTKDWIHNPAPIDYSTAEVPLTFQEWNQDLTLENIDRTLDYVIGATYVPTDGQSWIKIRITKTSGSNPIDALTQTIYYGLTGVGNTYINWGDGSIVIITKTTTTQEYLNTPHTYNDYGEYWISISRDSGTYTLGYNNSQYLLGLGRNNPLLEIRTGISVTALAEWCLALAASLKSISLSRGVFFNDYCFDSLKSIKTIVVPRKQKQISAVRNCNMEYISFASDIVRISALQTSRALKISIIPSTVTSFDGAFIQNSECLQKYIISSSYPIPAQAMRGLLACTLYDFSRCTQVPTLNNVNAFLNINSNAIMKVPDKLYDKWIVTTNWSTFSNFIMKVSEYDRLYNN